MDNKSKQLLSEYMDVLYRITVGNIGLIKKVI